MASEVSVSQVEVESLQEWFDHDSISRGGRNKRLIGFAVAVLAARAAVANSTLSLTEYRMIADIVQDFSTLNDEESSIAAYFAISVGRSEEFTGICIEVLTLEFDEAEFSTLLERLAEIMTVDATLCTGDMEYLYEIYLRTCESLRRCNVRVRDEKSSYGERVLSVVRAEIARAFKNAAA